MYFAALLINAGNIDLRHELDDRREIWVTVATMDVDTVDSVLMCTLPKPRSSIRREAARTVGSSFWTSYMRRAQYRTIPVRHHHVVAISKTIGTSLY